MIYSPSWQRFIFHTQFLFWIFVLYLSMWICLSLLFKSSFNLHVFQGKQSCILSFYSSNSKGEFIDLAFGVTGFTGCSIREFIFCCFFRQIWLYFARSSDQPIFLRRTHSPQFLSSRIGFRLISFSAPPAGEKLIYRDACINIQYQLSEICNYNVMQ